MDPVTARTPESFPVAVVMERRTGKHGRWVSTRTEAVGVVAGISPGTHTRGEIIHSDDTTVRTLWPGFKLELFPDDALGYYSNLRGEAPGVFIICHPDEADGLYPTNVTVSYGEGASLSETDAEIFTVPMPPEIYRWVEAFVVEHYVPEQPRKRKRENWKDSAEPDPPRGRRG